MIQSNREISKNRSIAYINRGLAYYTLKDFAKSISDNTEAIKLDSQSAIAFHNRGLAYKNSGSLELALSDYSATLRLDPKYASAYVARGNVYLIKGDNDRAIADYNEAIRISPDVLAYFNRGLSYYAKKSYDQAISDYSSALRYNPQYALAFGGRCLAYENNGDKNRAIADCRQALSLDPNDQYSKEGCPGHDRFQDRNPDSCGADFTAQSSAGYGTKPEHQPVRFDGEYRWLSRLTVNVAQTT